MKKFLSIILAVISIFSCFSTVASAVFYDMPEKYMYIFTVEDARVILRTSVGLSNEDIEVGNINKFNSICDLTCDNIVDVADARIALRNAIKIEPISYKYFRKAVNVGLIDLYSDGSSTAYVFNEKMPSTKEEIVSFYKTASTRVANGAALYTKKEYQAIGDTNITGDTQADAAIKKAIQKYITEENEAKEQVYDVDSEIAIKNWSAKCTLADYDFIKSAACERVGANYKITIVTGDDDTPHKTGSVIEKMTQSVLWWEDIERELAEQSNILKSYDGVHFMYNSITFTAEITPEGKFVSLDMNANIDVIIGSAKIIKTTINDKQIHIDNFVKFYNFDYPNPLK